jgi:TraQ conjugal transfer protein
MKRFINNKRFGKYLPAFLVIILFSFSLLSCSRDELDIMNNFPFDVNVMPVPDDIAEGQTVEIRLTIKPAGNYNNSEYFIRYFQYDGQGILQHFDDPAYLPNDLYPLSSEQFRLYYTSQSAVSQSFEVWISDSFGNEKQLSFQFNNSD